MMKSKITGGKTNYLFTARLLSKYEVKYYQCEETGFIQTEEPYWLKEAYEAAIVALDVGLAMRNESLVADTQKILLKYFRDARLFVDFGGGYGQFVRMMRDRGFNFFLFDEYAENLYARFFSVTADELATNKYDLITSFEVFEHLVDPMDTLQQLMNSSDSILFSTELASRVKYQSASDWWYFVPEIGQHISFHTQDSLEYMAQKMGARLYTNGKNLHLITRKQLATNPFDYLKSFQRFEKWQRFIAKLPHKWHGNPKMKSLLGADSDYIKSKLLP